MKFNLIHVLPNRFPFGAYSMLEELHYAIDKYHSHEIEQYIYYISGKEEKAETFTLRADYMDLSDLKAHIKNEHTNPLVLCHRLARTNCEPISEMFYGYIPLAIVNHSYTMNFKGVAPCDMLICVSKEMTSTAKKRVPKYPRVMIRNGVNACRYEGYKPFKPKEVKGYFVTGRLNNLNACKHPNDWVTFIKNINIHKPIWHDYIGGGIHLNNASAQAKRKMVRQKQQNVVNMLGRINDFEEKVGYIKRWDAFLYEIKNKEGTSMSLLECLACGIPAIINNRPGNNEVVKNGINGYVYKERKEAMNMMNRLSKNPNELEELKESTKRYFVDNEFDAKFMAQKYAKLIKDLVSGR